MIKIVKIFAFQNLISEYLFMVGKLRNIFLLKSYKTGGEPNHADGLFFMGYIKSLIIPGKAEPPKIKGQLIRTLEPQIQAMSSKGTTWSNARMGRKGHKCIRLEYRRVGSI